LTAETAQAIRRHLRPQSGKVALTSGHVLGIATRCADGSVTAEDAAELPRVLADLGALILAIEKAEASALWS
jgi:hypothetical protein